MAVASEILMNYEEGLDRIKRQEWIGFVQNDLVKKIWSENIWNTPMRFEREYKSEWFLANEKIWWKDKTELERWVPDELFEP